MGCLQRSDEQTSILHENNEYISECDVTAGLFSEASSLEEIEFGNLQKFQQTNNTEKEKICRYVIRSY